MKSVITSVLITAACDVATQVRRINSAVFLDVFNKGTLILRSFSGLCVCVCSPFCMKFSRTYCTVYGSSAYLER